MLSYETGYAITQDYLDAEMAVPPEMATIDSSVYGVHGQTPRQHLLGLKAALLWIKEEADISIEVRIHLCNKSQLS